MSLVEALYKEPLSPGRGQLVISYPDDIEYPESDGEPMGETDFHVTAIMHLLEALRQYFRNHPDVYVAADMFLYYKKGFDEKKRLM